MTEEISFCQKTIGSDPEVLAYRVLLRTLEVPEKSKGGIIFTNTAKEEVSKRNNIGQVLKIGPFAFEGDHEVFRVNVGDWVHYSTLEREPVLSNGILCYYINDSRLLARISEKDVEAFCPIVAKG